MKFVANLKKSVLGSLELLLGGYSKDKVLGLYKTYLRPTQDIKIKNWICG